MITCSPIPLPTPADKDYLECMNPNSLEVLKGCKLEASLASANPRSGSSFCGWAISAPTAGTAAKAIWSSTGP